MFEKHEYYTFRSRWFEKITFLGGNLTIHDGGNIRFLWKPRSQ
jgi:hypothetical protein